MPVEPERWQGRTDSRGVLILYSGCNIGAWAAARPSSASRARPNDQLVAVAAAAATRHTSRTSSATVKNSSRQLSSTKAHTQPPRSTSNSPKWLRPQQ